jgi:hypothetical protein
MTADAAMQRFASWRAIQKTTANSYVIEIYT